MHAGQDSKSLMIFGDNNYQKGYVDERTAFWIRESNAVVDGTSCTNILAKKPGAPSGLYTIRHPKLKKAQAFKVYCDMVTDGGKCHMP